MNVESSCPCCRFIFLLLLFCVGCECFLKRLPRLLSDAGLTDYQTNRRTDGRTHEQPNKLINERMDEREMKERIDERHNLSDTDSNLYPAEIFECYNKKNPFQYRINLVL